MRRLHKRTILFYLFFISATAATAQTKKKDIFLNVGGYSGYGYPDGLPSPEFSGIPAIGAGGEYFLSKYIAAGSYIAYTHVFDKFGGSTYRYKEVWRGWDVGIKTCFHFNPLLNKKLKKFIDVYIAGIGGYTYRALRYDKSDIYRDILSYDVDALNIGGIFGFRYLPDKKIALYGELGKSREWFVGAGLNFTITSK